jgi:hypothetical protein
MSDEKRVAVVTSAREEMEALAARMRALIALQPPADLLGYVYAQRLLGGFRESEEPKEADKARETDTFIDDTQLVLEYIHATLASTPERGHHELQFNEAACAELFQVAGQLKAAAMFHAMASSAGTCDGAFGPNTGDVEFRAKSTWVLLRGNRYQVLEGEFYCFVLAPHDALLREVYGIGSAEIAAGVQEMANAVRVGHSEAFEVLKKQFDSAQVLAEQQGKPFKEVAAALAKGDPAGTQAAAEALEDILCGGICNVSRHTRLPSELLADLAYTRGEESDFFAEGPYAGTPFRTIPARKKPLIKLGEDFYGVDPCLTRDAAYRALLWNLLRRRPDYAERFNILQKGMSEAAFFQILTPQLRQAVVHQEVYYRDPLTRRWVENDTLIVIDDVLLLIEAKAGAAATIASPALDFARHARSVRDLVIKAYEQCKRFFEYLGSAEEVPIYRRADGRYLQVRRLRRSAFRLMVPIGLTVESFAPFSAMCKELPGIDVLLGKHAFISMSIDDLFVLKRLLPTIGEFAHYLEVRQAIASMKGAHLFDELDHLGAYIKKNRFDQDIEEERAKHRPNLMIVDGMSAVVDEHFGQFNWEAQPIPTQNIPSEMLGLLGALDRTRKPGWLSAESHIRSYGDEGRRELSTLLETLRGTLSEYPSRHISLAGETTLFIWLQRHGVHCNEATVRDRASAAALAARAETVIALLVVAEPTGRYISAERLKVEPPRERSSANARIYEEAERMRSRRKPIPQTD